LKGTLILTNLSSNSTGYIWDFYDGDQLYDFEPLYEYQYYNEGNFPVLLTSYNSCGTDTALLNHFVEYEKSLFVPNAIYPDHTDFRINKFNAVGIGLRTYSLMIFDTYGNLIFETNSLDNDGKPDEPWNGSYNNDGRQLKQDVYVWKVKALFKDNDQWEGKEYDNEKNKLYKTGTVTLIR
jgi:hypothetical protein